MLWLMRLVTGVRGLASFCALTIYCERDKYAPVAQLAAQAICNRQVSGFESPLGLQERIAEWVGALACLGLVGPLC